MKFHEVKKFIKERKWEHWGKFADAKCFWEFLFRDLEKEWTWEWAVSDEIYNPWLWLTKKEEEDMYKIAGKLSETNKEATCDLQYWTITFEFDMKESEWEEVV